MQHLELSYPGDRPAVRPAHVGVVGSGDLEVLVTPGPTTSAEVRIRTSVDGFDEVWRTVLERFFTRYGLAGSIEINDFGATPAVVSIRLLQALDSSTAEPSGEDRA